MHQSTLLPARPLIKKMPICPCVFIVLVFSMTGRKAGYWSYWGHCVCVFIQRCYRGWQGGKLCIEFENKN
jgi:hypothetical protein